MTKCMFVCVCTGAWLKSSLGYVQREGQQLSMTYIAPQLGYWVAAMSPLHSGEQLFPHCPSYAIDPHSPNTRPESWF